MKSMERAFWLDPRDKPALLLRMMRELCGDSRIALQGDLSSCDFSEVPGKIDGLVDPFRPEFGSGGVVLPLFPMTVDQIKRQLFPGGRIVRDIGSIQIEKGGRVEFVAADHFHRECVSVGRAVPEAFLRELVEAGVLRGYKPA